MPGFITPNARPSHFNFHPEFSSDFARELLTLRRGTKIEESLADRAIESYKTKSNQDLVVKAMARFLQSNIVP